MSERGSGRGEWRDGHQEGRDGRNKLRQRSKKDEVTEEPNKQLRLEAPRTVLT